MIIGRLIPARMDLSEEGRERLGITQEEEEAKAAAKALALNDLEGELEDISALLALDPVEASTVAKEG